MTRTLVFRLASAFGRMASIALLVGSCRDITVTETVCPLHAPPGTETQPVFNPRPVEFRSAPVQTDCSDRPLLDGRNLTTLSPRYSRYPASQEEHDQGVDARAGDVIRLLIFIHNDSYSTADQSTVARNVRLTIVADTLLGKAHRISAMVSANNANPITSADRRFGGDLTIHSSDATSLAALNGGSIFCVRYISAVEQNWDVTKTCAESDSSIHPDVGAPIPDSFFSATISLGDIKPGWDYQGVVVLLIRVGDR